MADNQRTRLFYIETITNNSEKILLSQINSFNYYQEEQTDSIYIHNSTLKSENNKLFKQCLSYYDNQSHIEQYFDKTLDCYITQFNLYPIILSTNHENNKQNDKTITDTLPKTNNTSVHSTKLRKDRVQFIEEYNNRKMAYMKQQKKCKSRRTISCFFCFGPSKEIIKIISKKPSIMNEKINKSKEKDKPNEVDDITIIPNNDNNLLIETTQPNNIINLYSNTHKANSHPNNNPPAINSHHLLFNDSFANEETGKNKDNQRKEIQINSMTRINPNISNNHLLSLNISPIMLFPLSPESKSISFILTNDLTKAILHITKSSNADFILHTFSYTFDKESYDNDPIITDLIVRTNLSQIIKSKQIKYPLLLYGNVFIPSITFFRANQEMQLKLLDKPITTPAILSQLLSNNFIQPMNIVQSINRQIIEETIAISEELNYETYMVNLIDYTDYAQLFTIIKNYLDIMKSHDEYKSNTLYFICKETVQDFNLLSSSVHLFKFIKEINYTPKIIPL